MPFSKKKNPLTAADGVASSKPRWVTHVYLEVVYYYKWIEGFKMDSLHQFLVKYSHDSTSIISISITISYLAIKQLYSRCLWGTLSPKGHKNALIKPSCQIVDLLKHKSNYRCTPAVPQLSVMRYFYHFFPAREGFGILKNAITQRNPPQKKRKTKRLTGLICCILNNNLQNGSGATRDPKATTPRQKNNFNQWKHMPTRNYCTSSSIIYWPAQQPRLFHISREKRHKKNGFLSPASKLSHVTQISLSAGIVEGGVGVAGYRWLGNDLGWALAGDNDAVNEKVNDTRAQSECRWVYFFCNPIR